MTVLLKFQRVRSAVPVISSLQTSLYPQTPDILTFLVFFSILIITNISEGPGQVYAA